MEVPSRVGRGRPHEYCAAHREGSKGGKWKRLYGSFHSRADALWRRAKERASKKGLPFDLTVAWVEEKLNAGRCEVTGLPFEFQTAGRGRRGGHPFAPSLDRADPSRGYTTDNVRVVVWIHNAARGSWGNDFLNVYIKHMAPRAEEVL